jgi:putative ABC transport system permease protein
MTVLSDLRYGFRRLAARPGFALVAVITLALGIGATTAIYSVVDSLMLKSLPYGDPERLVDLGFRTSGGEMRYFDGAQVDALKTRTDLFASVDKFNFAGTLSIGANEPAQLAGAVVGGDLFQTLAVPPQLGRLIDSSDVKNDRQVIVLSDGLWRSRFAADRAIVGKTIRVDNKSLEVIGVMPPTFRFPSRHQDFWIPYTSTTLPGGDARAMFAIGRLRSDRSVAQARALLEASTIDVRTRQGALEPAPLRIVAPLGNHLNAPVRTAIYLLAGAVGLVLLIACANIANLLLVQNAGRDREIAVRTALGASRGDLVRQLLVESSMLAIAGGMLGLLVAQWAIDLLIKGAPEDSGILTINAAGIDGRVLLFAIVATSVAAILSGILPAVRAARRSSHGALRFAGRTSTDGPKHERVRNAVVAFQLALSVALLVGATLLARTFVQLTRVDAGFEVPGLAIMTVELPRWKYPTPSARQEFFDTLVSRVHRLPGVTGVVVGSGAPPGGGGINLGLTVDIEGRGIVLDERRMEVPHSWVAADYFSLLRLPILAGRAFNAEDGPGAPRAIAINQEMAARLWGRPDAAIGQRFRMSTRADAPWYTVVGVVGNVYQLDYAHPSGQFAYYLPLSQTAMGSNMTMVARTTGNPGDLLPLIRQQVRAIDPTQAIWRLRTGEAQYAEFLALPRFYTLLMGVLAGLGVTIAAIGLYGVLAYAISQRTREFGVRLALGAQQSDVLGMVLRSGATITAIGLIAGGVASLFMTRWIESMLINVPRLDPVSYLLAALLFATIAFAACWMPARRATRVDPVVALRHE